MANVKLKVSQFSCPLKLNTTQLRSFQLTQGIVVREDHAG